MVESAPLRHKNFQLTAYYFHLIPYRSSCFYFPAYWKAGVADTIATFDLYFRKCPFKGHFALAAGLEDALSYMESFQFSKSDLEYLATIMPDATPEFFTWLGSLSTADVVVYAIPEGTPVFPNEPLMRITGPLAVVQLLETTLLNLVNFATLVTTNATRMKLVAGPGKSLLEFGLRRAQGPDGGMSASRYSYLGGFDGSSNVAAGARFGMPIKGTHAHAFVCTFGSLNDLKSKSLGSLSSDFVADVHKAAQDLGLTDNRNMGELAAFIAYAQAFPSGFLALVDTYDTLGSGVPNFMAVGLALARLGKSPIGIRLDSGDLAALSKGARAMWKDADAKLVKAGQSAVFSNLVIVASNDINEKTLHELNQAGHEINSFGIGTNLVTCQAQPALGGVFKLVDFNGAPRIKLSNELAKATLPGKKTVYRLLGPKREPLADLIALDSEPAPKPDAPVEVRAAHVVADRVTVTPAFVEPLMSFIWKGPGSSTAPTLSQARSHAVSQIDHWSKTCPAFDTRAGSAYRVGVSVELYKLLHAMIATHAEGDPSVDPSA